MAGTDKCFTMQGFGTPVSAVGQGEKAGPQPSSSNDRSSTVVGNLATVEYEVTRKEPTRHRCNKSCDGFCYVCGDLVVRKNRKALSENLQSIYKSCFGIDVAHQDTHWVPHTICNSCRTMHQKI